MVSMSRDSVVLVDSDVDALAWQRAHYLVVAGHDELVGFLVMRKTGHWISHVVRASGGFCGVISRRGI